MKLKYELCLSGSLRTDRMVEKLAKLDIKCEVIGNEAMTLKKAIILDLPDDADAEALINVGAILGMIEASPL